MLFDDMADPDDDLFDEDDLLDADDDSEAVADEGLPNARNSTDLLGHQAIESSLLNMLDTGRFPHGLIFSGPSGIGKSVMAYRLARFLFSEADREPDMFGAPPKPTSLLVAPDHPVFAKVASGAHPDLLVIERPTDPDTGRTKASIPVEEIRRITPFLRRTSSIEGGWRIVIVDDADTMTRSSQNSLLKILEEPPEKTVLVLITHRAGALLPTVYSRCVHLPFQALSNDLIFPALTKMGVSTHDQALITEMAGGSLGKATDYAVTEHLEIIRTSFLPFESWPSFDWGAIQTFADLFGTKGNDDAQRIFAESILWLATALVLGRHGRIDWINAIIDRLSLEQRLALYDRAQAHLQSCQNGNLDKRFLIMGAYMAFEA